MTGEKHPRPMRYIRHKEGKNSTAGWTPEARAAAAERMRRRRGNNTGKNSAGWARRLEIKAMGGLPPKKPKGPRRGRPKLEWTKERRRECSRRMKRRWANATPEDREKMLTFSRCGRTNFHTHEELVAFQSKVDQVAKGKKISAIRRAKFASGEFDYLREGMRQRCKAEWENLPQEEKDRRILILRNSLKMNRNYRDGDGKSTKKYTDVRFHDEQKRLYQLAKEAMRSTGMQPKKKQGIGYYRQLIEFFRPDLVDWEV